MSALVEIKDVCKVYNPGENEVRALDHVSLTIDEQEFVAIIGQSGSGKSTLMNMLGCLDVCTSGQYLIDGQDVSNLSDDEFSEIRNNEIGFILLDEDGNEQEYYYVDEDNDGDGVRVERTSDGDEFDLGISREGVAAATRDVNAIYKDGVAVAAELKGAFDAIKSAFDFKGILKK